MHARSYMEAFEKLGIGFSEKEYYDIWTRQGKGIGEFLAARNLTANPEEIRSMKRKRYIELVQADPGVIRGAPEKIAELSRSFPLYLVTASYSYSAGLILDKIRCRGFFAGVITGDDVKLRKPHPEALLLAARTMKIGPADIAVIDDAEKGIVAAHRAGMKSIAIPTEFTKDNDFSQATRTVGSIADVTPGLIRSLFRAL
ncbi:MAG: HAD family phosphatase [archaeon]